jgi:hypothetical protein
MEKVCWTAQHRTVWRHTQDSPVYTGQTGAQSVQLPALENSGLRRL